MMKCMSEPTRVKIFGDILQEQEDYYNATKKFSYAGDKGRAMKIQVDVGLNQLRPFYFFIPTRVKPEVIGL